MSNLATMPQSEAVVSQFEPETFGRAFALAVEMLSIDPTQLWSEDDLVDRFIETRRSPNTKDSYRRDVDHFRRWLHATYGGELDLRAVAYEHADEYCRYLRECVARLDLSKEILVATGLEAFSKATVNRKVSALSSFYKWSSAARRRRQTGIHLNPIDFDRFKVNNSFSDRALTETQVLKLIDAAFNPASSRVRYAYRDGCLVRLIYHAGLRVSEATSRQWKHLKRLERDDSTGGGVLTVTGKGDKKRPIVISQEVMELLEELRGDAAPDDYLFFSERGGPLDRDSVSAILRRACKDAGVPEVTPHILRHSHATHYRQRGGDMVLLKDTLGHSSFDTTSHYIKANPTDSSGLHLVA
jgi:site-specific recombinase XerD